MAVQITTSADLQHQQGQSVRIPPSKSSLSGKRPIRPAFKREKSGNSKNKRVSIEDPDPQDFWVFDDMTASFPQFCTMCENQIIVPNSTVLYCSESCRRRDMNKPLSSSMPATSYLHSRPLTPIQSYHSSGQASPPIGRDIIPQKSPTAITANRTSFTDLSSIGGSDLDEDVVVLQEPCHQRPRECQRQESEAAKYLRQFHSSSFSAEMSSRSVRRPKPYSRSSTMSIAPSLTHSPSPGTSPISITPLSSLPVTYSRPLPSRVNPYSSSFGAKSINLVTPMAGAQSLPQTRSSASLPGLKAQASIAMDVGVEDLPNELPVEELRYDKVSVLGSTSDQSKSNLRSLFRFDEMQAPPS